LVRKAGAKPVEKPTYNAGGRWIWGGKEKEKKAVKKIPKNYQASRLNATRHGVLSRDTILPWEDPEEYEELLRSLTQDNGPVGTVEALLVEEIAFIFWRNRRLRLAEAAAFRNQYRRLLTLDSSKIAESGLLGKLSLPEFDPHLGETFTMTSEEVARELKVAQTHLQHSQKALEILDTNSRNSHQLALKALGPDSRQYWEAESASQEDSATPNNFFRDFLLRDIIETHTRIALLANHSSIMAQAQGEAFDSELLGNLARYEVFLDRKLQRTLGTLLQLQDFRRKRTTTTSLQPIP
jgi:hypothetical protein